MKNLVRRNEREELSLVAVGDISLGGRVNEKIEHYNPFELIENEIKNSGISIGNLECVIGKKGKPVRTYTNLRADSHGVKYLKIFTLLSLANNHILDYGIEGMNETVEVLRRNEILTLGAGENYQSALRPLIIESGSLRIGFISFMQDEFTLFPTLQRTRQMNRPGPARYFEKDVLHWIRKLKEKTDFLIASVHWGREYVDYPSPQQRLLAKKLVRNGVNIIFGHHPHAIQGIQRYRNGLIFYSLGNFIFDTALSFAKYGLMVFLSLSDKGISKYKLIPLSINENFQPIRLAEESSFLEYLQDISKPLSYPDAVYNNFWYEHAAKAYFKAYKSNIILVKKFGTRYLGSFFFGLTLPYSIKFYAGFIRHLFRSNRDFKCAEI